MQMIEHQKIRVHMYYYVSMYVCMYACMHACINLIGFLIKLLERNMEVDFGEAKLIDIGSS